MPLPDLIEIIPLDKPVRAEITVPGSKSITNRALILAALADGEVTLRGALWSEDTQVMTEALQKLGFEIKVEQDPDEFCNRIITVKGQGGRIPNAGTAEKPLELFVGNAGTAARFLAAMVCLGNGVYRLSGVPRMHERPQAALFKALRELGYRVDSANDKLPATIFCAERGCVADQPQRLGTAAADASRTAALRSCTVSIAESSQFASALLLCARHGGWEVNVAGDDAEEAPYVTMTEKLVEVFPWGGGKFQIEPDASSGSYFWGAGFLLLLAQQENDDSSTGIRRFETDFMARLTDDRQLPSLMFRHWPVSNWQIDQRFPTLLPYPPQSRIQEMVSRSDDLGDSIMTAIVLSPFTEAPVRFTDLGRLRVQECERVVALRTELTKCGAKVIEEGDTLTVYPSKLHGAEIETYNDHRMAMCFAILGLKVPGIKLKNPSCVKKTFPNFFQKMAAAPPHGLGAEIWEVRDGKRTRKLEGEDLFAD
ncbi:MAG TPA: 3-phosphoshikimate 1-carboxyvinyltransferase [Verrucomicrobiota bacterium]|nr:3-phosphoshikimate 1-carboxyvinyltransferase [Verrucomicrobiota bacterium]